LVVVVGLALVRHWSSAGQQQEAQDRCFFLQIEKQALQQQQVPVPAETRRSIIAHCAFVCSFAAQPDFRVAG